MVAVEPVSGIKKLHREELHRVLAGARIRTVQVDHRVSGRAGLADEEPVLRPGEDEFGPEAPCVPSRLHSYAPAQRGDARKRRAALQLRADVIHAQVQRNLRSDGNRYVGLAAGEAGIGLPVVRLAQTLADPPRGGREYEPADRVPEQAGLRPQPR